MRTTLTRPGGAAAPDVVPYASAANLRRAVRRVSALLRPRGSAPPASGARRVRLPRGPGLPGPHGSSSAPPPLYERRWYGGGFQTFVSNRRHQLAPPPTATPAILKTPAEEGHQLRQRETRQTTSRTHETEPRRATSTNPGLALPHTTPRPTPPNRNCNPRAPRPSHRVTLAVASPDPLGRRGARACAAGRLPGSRAAAICCAAARGSRQIRVSWLRVTWSVGSKQRRGGSRRPGAAAAAAYRAAAAFRKLQAGFLPEA
ncbi:unnamed protein product [Rangifer tarandus platyrhynchus]|uniref:Uncharacterized protein n=1 Tax=Rangifer tarandus platyrhynchus TaxID=3082113 RepID=A0ABN8YC75_RANTA|nr:unnamed protein product [Rangifer tarandus platyrhynchus]